MFKLYLVNKDNPAAISMAKKLADYVPKPGGFIVCTKEEIASQLNGELIEVTRPSPEEGKTHNEHFELLELDINKHYLAVCKKRSVELKALDRLNQRLHGKLTVLFTKE